MPNRLRRSYLGFQICFALLFWHPIFYDFQKRLGLSDREILGIQSLYYVAFCLFEFPTGFLADRLGRRLSARLGAVIAVLANILPALCVEIGGLSQRSLYWGMLTHFMALALARSLVSGAASAYLYDQLKRVGRTEEYAPLEGKARAWSLISRVFGWIGIGAAMQWHLSIPYWLTAAGAAAAFGFAWSLPEGGESEDFSKPTVSSPWMRISEVFNAIRSTPTIGLTMAQGIAVFAMDRIVLVNLFQPILNAKELGLLAAGPVLAWVSVTEAVAASQVKRFEKRFEVPRGTRVLVLTAIMGMSLGWMGWAGPRLTLALFTVYSLAAGFAYPLQRQAMNEAIPDSRFRATLISVESLIDRAVCALVAWLLVGFLERREVETFLHLTGLCTLVFVILVMILRRFAEAELPFSSDER